MLRVTPNRWVCSMACVRSGSFGSPGCFGSNHLSDGFSEPEV